MVATNDDPRTQFLSLRTRSDVARLLHVSVRQLNYILYLHKPQYTTFEVPKKSGNSRLISAPNPQLKYLQRGLADALLHVYDCKPSVYGFVPGRSIVQNANAHRKRKYVLNIDLKDFFLSIHFGRVRG